MTRVVRGGLRTRWAAIGAAVAVALGAGGGISLVNAAVSSGERSVFVAITPCRLADLRPAPDTVGPRTTPLGPADTYTFDGWGKVGKCTLPTGTTGLSLNVTAVGATQKTNLRFFPADATLPTASNLNPAPGQPATPNAVTIGLSDTGQFKAYNAFGNVSVIVDVVGVYQDHNHDDRYYTKTQSNSRYYTRTQVDSLLSGSYTCAATDFFPADGSGGWVGAAARSSSGVLYCGVHIPLGAEVTGFSAAMIDNNLGSDSFCYLYRRQLVTTTFTSLGFTESTVGSSTNIQLLQAATQVPYVMPPDTTLVVGCSTGPALSIVGATVTFTVAGSGI
jgi:hypothetical protein